MRKNISVLFVCFFLLQSCSSAKAEPSRTPKPTLTPTITITPTQTITPTITPSPTIVKIPTFDYFATATPPAYIYTPPTPLPGMPTATPVPSSTPSLPGAGFEWIKTSEQRLYWGACRSNNLRVTAQVSEPDDVHSVVFFMRLRNLKAQIFTPWNKGLGMEPVGKEGLWAQNLYGSSVDGHISFRRGWVWYQLVATGKDNIEVGRSRIFVDEIKLQPCMCLTPPCNP